MSVRSENFNNLIAMVVADDKQGVIGFLRSQGVTVSSGADVKDVVEALYVGFRSSKFANAFSSWADNKYSSNANAGGGSMASAGSGFDPMDTQSGGFSPMETQFANAGHMPMANASGGEFDPMDTQSGGFTPISTQQGTNLKEDRFANAGHMPVANAGGDFDPMSTQGGGEFDPMSTQSGTDLMADNFANAGGEFDPMDTQSGGFSPISTQDGSNLKGERFANAKGYKPFDPTAKVGTTGSGFGNFLRGQDWGGLISSGVGIWQGKEASDQQKDLLNAQQKAGELELQKLLAQNQLSQTQYEHQLAILREQNKAPQGNVILYVIGGVVLLAGIGTAIYFATRKK